MVERMDGWTDGGIDGWMDGGVDEWTDQQTEMDGEGRRRTETDGDRQ